MLVKNITVDPRHLHYVKPKDRSIITVTLEPNEAKEIPPMLWEDMKKQKAIKNWLQNSVLSEVKH